MEIKLDKKELLSLVHTCLCGGSWGFGSQILGSEEGSYKKARTALLERKGEDYLVCYEDVYVMILEMGGNLYLEDSDYGDKEYFNIDTLTEGLKNVNPVRLMKIIGGKDFDSIDTDCIIQELVFGEVVFG